MTVRTGKDAATWARGQVGKDAFHNMCKAFVRTAFNVEPSMSATAIEAWREARGKHFTKDPEKIPAFVPVFMDTSAPAEHVVITVGRNADGHRLCVSTDAGPGRTIGLVRLDRLAASWGPILGWSEYLDGQRIWSPPPPSQAQVWALARAADAALEKAHDALVAVTRTGDAPWSDKAHNANVHVAEARASLGVK